MFGLSAKQEERMAELEARLMDAEQEAFEAHDTAIEMEEKLHNVANRHLMEKKQLEAKVQALTQALAAQQAMTPPAPIIIKKPTVKIKQRRYINSDELGNQPVLQLQMIRNRFQIEHDDDNRLGNQVLTDWLDENCTGLYSTWEDPQTWAISLVAFELDEDWALFKLKFHGLPAK